MLSDLNYLHNDTLTQEQIEAQTKIKYANAKHIAKIEPKKKSLSILEQRRKPPAPIEEDHTDIEPPKVQEKGPVYLKTDTKSSVMQQIELNLQEIEKIRESLVDQEQEAREKEL